MNIHWVNLIVGILIIISFIFSLGASFDGGIYSLIFMTIWILIIGIKQLNKEF